MTSDPIIVVSLINLAGGILTGWLIPQVVARFTRARAERLGRESAEDTLRRRVYEWRESAYDQRRAAIQAGVAADTLPDLPDDDT